MQKALGMLVKSGKIQSVLAKLTAALWNSQRKQVDGEIVTCQS